MLGCKTLTNVEVYSQFILPKFGSFSDLGRLEHLQFIKLLFKKSFKIESYQEKLIPLKEQLQSCPILYHSSSKCLRCASSFYDAREELFIKFESPVDFPSPPYDGEDWPDFLIECGLVNVVSDRKLLDYAKRMAKNYDPENVKLIVEKLMGRDLIDEYILDEMKLIKFINRVSTDPGNPGNPGKTLEFKKILEILEKPWNSVKNPGKNNIKVNICRYLLTFVDI